jgi:hypothetical protein
VYGDDRTKARIKTGAIVVLALLVVAGFGLYFDASH